jgi:hypothetical protein
MDHAAACESRHIDGAFDYGLVTRQPVFFFDLAPVLENSQPSFARNPERLRNICEHSLGNLADEDLTLFTDTGFYVIFSSCDVDEAAIHANRINVSLLKVLFGTDSLTAHQLVPMFRAATMEELKGTGEAGTNIVTRAAAIVDRKQTTEAEAQYSFDGVCEDEEEQLHLLATRGVYPRDEVRLSFSPVYDIKRGVPAIFFCRPLAKRDGKPVFGYRAFRNLSPLEQAHIDQAILRYATSYAVRLQQMGSPIIVGVPVSAESLNWSRGRQIYLNALRQTGIANNPQLIPLLDGFSPGTPSNRIADLTSILRPFTRRVAVYLPNCDTAVERSGVIGASGYALHVSTKSDPATMHRAAFWLARLCLTQGAFSCLTGVHSQAALDAARSAGLKFAAGSALAPRALTEGASLEFARATVDVQSGADAFSA